MSSLFTIRTVRNRPSDSILVEPEVNGVKLVMELDTGASISIISRRTWETKFPDTVLKESNLPLKTYTGEKLQVLGELPVTVCHNGQEFQLPLVVVEGQGPPLFGRNWLSKIRLNWAHIRHVSSELDQLLSKYSELFQDKLGTIKGLEAKLTVDPEASPKFFKPRPVPYALRGAIERDLECLETLGVIEWVNHSDWAAPVVPVPKADGSVCLCGDYKVTLNPVLQVDQFPVPKPEDLFANLAGGKTFSKLDLSHAYQQVLLEPGSLPLTHTMDYISTIAYPSVLPLPPLCSSKPWRKFYLVFPWLSYTSMISLSLGERMRSTWRTWGVCWSDYSSMDSG